MSEMFDLLNQQVRGALEPLKRNKIFKFFTENIPASGVDVGMTSGAATSEMLKSLIPHGLIERDPESVASLLKLMTKGFPSSLYKDLEHFHVLPPGERIDVYSPEITAALPGEKVSGWGGAFTRPSRQWLTGDPQYKDWTPEISTMPVGYTKPAAQKWPRGLPIPGEFVPTVGHEGGHALHWDLTRDALNAEGMPASLEARENLYNNPTYFGKFNESIADFLGNEMLERTGLPKIYRKEWPNVEKNTKWFEEHANAQGKSGEDYLRDQLRLLVQKLYRP
jgi:hypothetical protein